MVIVTALLNFIQSSLDLIGASSEAQDSTRDKKMKKTWLMVAFISLACAATAFYFELSFMIAEALNTPLVYASAALISNIPIFGVLATALILTLSLRKIYNFAKDPLISDSDRKWHYAIAAIKLLLHLALLLLTIALLSFPPTAVPLATIILVVSIVSICFTLYHSYQDRLRNAAFPGPSLGSETLINGTPVVIHQPHDHAALHLLTPSLNLNENRALTESSRAPSEEHPDSSKVHIITQSQSAHLEKCTLVFPEKEDSK